MCLLKRPREEFWTWRFPCLRFLIANSTSGVRLCGESCPSQHPSRSRCPPSGSFLEVSSSFCFLPPPTVASQVVPSAQWVVSCLQLTSCSSSASLCYAVRHAHIFSDAIWLFSLRILLPTLFIPWVPGSSRSSGGCSLYPLFLNFHWILFHRFWTSCIFVCSICSSLDNS